jgi:hypothetical protein
MLPTFLIIGGQKCGTSSLWAYLRAHPQVFVPSVKELDFFSPPGDVDVERYRRWFDAASEAVAVGEASTSYTMFPATDDVPAKIARVIPDARLIYLTRDPLERMRSSYQHRLSAGSEHRPIGRALLCDPTYVQISMYATQVERYLQCFPRSQLLLLTSEDLRRNRSQALRDVLSFIGVDPDWSPPDVSAEHNTSAARQRAPRAWSRLAADALIRSGATRFVPNRGVTALSHPLATRRIRASELDIPLDVRHQLIDVLRPDIARLAALMPSSFDGWGLLDQPGREMSANERSWRADKGT